MKAWVLSDIGQIECMDVPKPEPAPGEALIRMLAAGICGSDVPRVYKTGAHMMPLIPGHEFSGVVELVDGESSFSPGDRVGIFPLIPCCKCESCQKGFYEMCRNYDYVGSRRDGAFAEYVTVPLKNLIKLPDEVSFEEAAMLEPMAVAVHAMRRGLGILAGIGSESQINTDVSVCVCGLGTIGMLLIDFLFEAGFRNIYAIGRRQTQRDRFAATAGRYLSDKDHSEWVDEHYVQSPSACDLFFECVGTNECINLAVESTAPGGSIVFVGNPASDVSFPRDVYWKILRNQIRITGTWNSSFAYGRNEGLASGEDDWRYVLKRLKDRTVHPVSLITHKLPLEGLEEGLAIMRDKTEDYCKIMLIIGD